MAHDMDALLFKPAACVAFSKLGYSAITLFSSSILATRFLVPVLPTSCPIFIAVSANYHRYPQYTNPRSIALLTSFKTNSESVLNSLSISTNVL